MQTIGNIDVPFCLDCEKQVGANRALQGAWKKGWAARLRGESIDACPYFDLRTNYHEGATFSRTWIHHWEGGWKAADLAKKEGRLSSRTVRKAS